MTRRVLRSATLGAVGAAAGLVCLIAAYGARPAIVLDMDRDLPSVTIGFFDVERSGEGTYAWTSERADVTLRGLDRRVPWTCAIALRAARAEPPLPTVRIAIDGLEVYDGATTGGADRIEVAVPVRRGADGLRLTLRVSPTFVPGPEDPRRLGVQVDRLSCEPAGAMPWPPSRAMAAAALSTAALAAAFAVMGLPTLAVLGGIAILAPVQAWVLASGVALVSSYIDLVPWLAFWVGVGAVALVAVLTRYPGASDASARLAVAVSAAVVFLKLLALLHPSKHPVDALFHAHRLDWVLAGRFYFTQLSTSATPFPYAIGLYLFAAPWTLLADDHVMLLRVVVCAAEAAAGLLLYAMIARVWGDRRTGLLAVLLFSGIPLSYVILGNANLTSAFGSAVAISAVAMVGTWAGAGRRWTVGLLLTLVITLGFVSHISTLALLTAALIITAALYWLQGGPPLRAAARTVVVATAAAMVLAVAGYWGHFESVYRQQLQRALAATEVSSRTESPGLSAEPGSGAPLQGLGQRTIPLGERAWGAVMQTGANLGWPLIVLGAVGLIRLGRARAGDRVGLVVVSWGVTWLGFLAVAVLAPGNASYQQDAWEFIGRVEASTLPAAVVLGALAASDLWDRGGLYRAASGLLVLGSIAAGARAWGAWLLPS